MTWLKENGSGLTMILVAIGLAVAITFNPGCNPQEFIKMPVPTAMQPDAGATQVPLSEYQAVRQRYMDRMSQTLTQADASYTDGMFWADIAASGIQMGLEGGKGMLSGMPGGALGIAGLSLLGGLFMKKPGTKAAENKAVEDGKAQVKAEMEKLMKEKIDSFNAGLGIKPTPVTTSE